MGMKIQFKSWLLLLWCISSVCYAVVKNPYPYTLVLPNQDGSKALVQERVWNATQKAYNYYISIFDEALSRHILSPALTNKTAAWGKENVIYYVENMDTPKQAILWEYNIIDKQKKMILTLNDHHFNTLNLNVAGSKALIVSTHFPVKQSDIIQFPENSELVNDLLIVDLQSKQVQNFEKTFLPDNLKSFVEAKWLPTNNNIIIAKVNQNTSYKASWNTKLFEIDLSEKNGIMLNDADDNIISFIVSHDGSKIAYNNAIKETNETSKAYQTFQYWAYD